jgi:hypothetical protein
MAKRLTVIVLSRGSEGTFMLMGFVSKATWPSPLLWYYHELR